MENKLNITKVVSDYLSRAWKADVSYLEYFEQIREYEDWFKGETRWHKYKIWNGKKRKSQQHLSLGMAKTVCEDMASLVMNEKVTIQCKNQTAEALVKEVLLKNNFKVMSNQLCELMFALGTGAFVESLKPGTDISCVKTKDVMLSYIHGDFIFPIRWDNGEITDCAFVTVGNNDGNVTYRVIAYIKEEDGYCAYVQEIDGDGGVIKKADIQSEIEYIEEKGFKYKMGLQTPPFQIIRPNIVNNFDKTNPMGMSIFGNALDVLKSIDETYSSLKNEFRLGRKRIFVKAGLKSIRYEPKEDNWIDYIDDNEMVYQQLAEEWEGNKPPIYESNMVLRVDDHNKALETQLNLLSRKVGLGENFYTFNGSSISTATQIISSNSSLFRNIRKHELVLEQALISLTEAICSYLQVEPGEITVDFDDSIIIDNEAEQNQAMTEYNAGLIDSVEYFVITKKMTRNQALDFVAEMEATGKLKSAEDILAEKYSQDMTGNENMEENNE